MAEMVAVAWPAFDGWPVLPSCRYRFAHGVRWLTGMADGKGDASAARRWLLVRDLLDRVLQLSPDQRKVYLDEACAGDSALRAQVDSLVAAAESSGKPAGRPLAPLRAGQMVSHYRIESKIGEGGMGAVYKATDVNLGRMAALKVMAHSGAGPESQARFAREAKAASALNHPHIVTVYEFGSDQSIDFIAMELVEGNTLSKVLEQARETGKATPLPVLFEYMRQVAMALSKAHAAGVVHRDLKPGNVMVTPEGTVKVLDFGLAKQNPVSPAAPEDTTATALTRIGGLVGTPAYMSPEQAKGEMVTHRSDIFSFGILFYEAVCGFRPFRGADPVTTMSQIILQDPAPVSQFNPAVPVAVAALIMACLQKDPARRPATMDAALTALSAAPGSSGASRLWIAIAASILATVGLGVGIWRTKVTSDGPPGRANLPASSQDWVVRGQAFLARYDISGYRESAVEAFQKAIEMDPRNAGAYAGLAEAFLSRVTRANADEQWVNLALDAARQSVKLNSHLASGHAALGAAQFLLGREAEAAASLDQALALDPGSVLGHQYKARLSEKRKDLTAAAQSYVAATAAAPGDWRVHSQYGSFLYRAGRHEEALAAFEAANRLAQDNSSVLSNLGAVYHALGRDDDAARAFQSSLVLTPTARGFSNLGTLLFYTGRYSESAEAFQKAVEMDAQSHIRWGNLGDAQRWTPGSRARSIEAYARAIQLAEEDRAKSPGDVSTAASLAGYLAKSGRTAEALQLADSVALGGGMTATARYRLAIVNELCQRRRKALELLEQAAAGGYSPREIRNEPEFIALRRDPGYARVARKIPESPRQ